MSVKSIFSDIISLPADLKSRSFTIQKKLLAPAHSLFTAAGQPNVPLKRKKEIENQQFIRDRSILAKQVEKPVLQASPQLHAVLGHIHGDAIIGQSNLEVLPTSIGARTMAQYLNSSNIQVPKTLLSALDQYQKISRKLADLPLQTDESTRLIYTFAQELMRAVYDLPAGSSFLIEGGRVSPDRIEHPVIFEFIKKENGNYDLFVYLTGKEAGQYRTVLYKDGKSWLRPFIHYQNIPVSALFFTDAKQKPQSDLFQAIIETKLLTQKNFSAEYVALKLLGHLQKYRFVEPAQETAGFISAARAHTDVWRGVKAVALRHMGKKLYKKMIADIKLRSLIEGYQLSKGSLGHDTVQDSQIRVVLKTGAKNLLKSLASLSQQGLIEDGYLLTARATALDLIEKIDIAEKEVENTRKKATVAFSLAPFLEDSQRTARAKVIQEAKALVISPPQDLTDITSACTRELILPPATKLTAYLNDLVTYYAEKKPEPYVITAEIENLVSQFPLPDIQGHSAYWNQVPHQELADMMDAFEKLLRHYERAFRANHRAVSPKDANTVFAMYALMHHTALRIDRDKNCYSANSPSSLSYYPVYFPDMSNDADPYLVFTSPEDFERRQALVNYFKGTYLNNPNLGHEDITLGWETVWQKRGSVPSPLFDFARECHFNKQTVGRGLPYFLAEISKAHPGLGTKGSDESAAINLVRHLAPNNKRNRFTDAGLGYIPSLAYAAFASHMFSSHPELLQGEKSGFVVDTRITSGNCTVSYKIDGAKQELKGASTPSSRDLHPKMQPGYYDLLKYKWAQRLKNADTSREEGAVLGEEEIKAKTDADGKTLLRFACEPSLYLYNLLRYYSDLELLESSSEQALFEIEFFRTTILYNSTGISQHDKEFELFTSLQAQWGPYMRQTFFAVQEELKQAGFKERCKNFIQEGIDRYYLRQPNQRPQVFATLFFVRLAIRLSRFLEAEEFVDAIPCIENMLACTDLTAEERSALSLHLIVGYQAKHQKLTEREVEKLFSAWVYYKNTPLSAEWHNPLLEKDAEAFIHANCHLLQNSSVEFKKLTIAASLQQLGAGSLPEHYQIISAHPHIFKIKLPENVFWEINLLTGALGTNCGKLQRASAPKWTNDKLFNHLFSSARFSYVQTGAIMYCNDERLGAFRVVGNDFEKGLQRNIDGVWYQYVPPKALDQKGIPAALLADHTHWVSIDQGHQILLICDLKTAKPVAKITETAQIVSGEMKLWAADTDRTLSKFERPEYILVAADSKGINSFILPRYLSQSGEILTFDCIEGQAVYSANKKYVLSMAQKEGVIGGIGQYLHLQHQKEAKEKVLVPFSKISRYAPLSTSHELDVADHFPSWKNGEELYSSQNSSKTFFEYDLKNGQLVPLTQEGTFYLALLLLTQRKYADAISWIHQIDFREPISEQSVEILHRIIDLGQSGKDASAEAAAIALHAFVLGKQAEERAKVEGKIKKHTDGSGKNFLFENPEKPIAISRAMAIYYHHCHSLGTEFLLTQSQEKYLRPTEVEGQIIYYPNIQKFEPPPAGPIDVPIGELTLPFPKDGFILTGLSNRQDADLNANSNNSYVVTKTNFLPGLYEKEPHSVYREPFLLTVRHTKEFEKGFFPEAYQIAQFGSDVEKAQLSFRLQLVGELYNRAPPEAWTDLQFALQHPNSAPPLPSYKNAADRWEFLKQLHAAMKPFRNDNRRELNPLAEERTAYTASEPAKPIAAQILPPKEVKAVESPLQLFIPQQDQIEKDFTEVLFAAHFTALDKPEHASVHSFAFDPAWIQSEEERAFENALKAEYKDFEKDYTAGIKINQERTFYSLNKLEELKSSVKSHIQHIDGELQDLETVILELANKQPSGTTIQKLREESGSLHELTMKELAALFLQGDKKRFIAANPFLKNPDFVKSLAEKYGLSPEPDMAVEYLYNLIGLYMSFSVYKNRLSRAQALCTKIGKIQDPASLERQSFIQKLADELQPKQRVYDVCNNPKLLVFEYLSGLSIRADQATILDKILTRNPVSGNYINRVIQLIMGGGKTSVIAVIVLMLAAQPGRLSLFVTPSPQYATVGANLRKAHWDYFGQEMEEIDISREQLTPEMCEEIENRLQNAMRCGHFLLVKSETLQCLELEFLDLIYKACEASRPSDALLKQINTLRRILLIFKEHGDALLDEVDLVLHVLFEVNFPIGDEVHIEPERIDLVRTIFSLLSQEKVAINKTEFVNLKKLVGLQENRQTLLSKQNLHGVVAQAVAWNLAHNHEALKLQHTDFAPSFCRYINGTMDFNCQLILDRPDDPSLSKRIQSLSADSRKDLEFLRYVRVLRDSSAKEDEEAAHQIAFVKHLFLDIFPITFEKTGKRHYGRDVSEKGGVCPYSGVGAPSRNKFGNSSEELVYHFLTAMQSGIEEEQLKNVAGMYRRKAEFYSDKEKIPLDETLEAKEFKELTTVSLHEINNPEKLKKAISHLNENIESLLSIEAETATCCVTYHPFRLTSTGCALVKMLNTVRAMSGTPYNVNCYEDSLANNFEPAWGTEGQIADLVLSRAVSNKNSTHIVHKKTPTEILQELLEAHPNRNRVRLLLDSGALFKDFSNYEVAKAIRDYLKIPVLFFMRNPRTGEKTPDTLALLKLNSDTPVIVGGTSPEDIEKTGLSVEEYFVFDDDRHTTGTNIDVIPDALGLMTLDETILRRTFFQTILRLRGYFLNQDVEFVIPEHILPALLSAKTRNANFDRVLGTLQKSIKNQAIQKALEYRAFKQEIDNVFRQGLSKNLLHNELTKENLKPKFLPFKDVTIVSQKDQPYDQFGALEYPTDSIESLLAYKHRKLEAFKKGNPPAEIVQSVSDKIDAVIEKAKKSVYLPKTILEAGSDNLGTEVNMLQEVSAQTQTETNQQINKDVLRELRNYQKIELRGIRKEDDWSPDDIAAFLRNLVSGNNRFAQIGKKIGAKEELYPVNALFKKEHFAYSQDFTKVFGETLLATPSWVFTCPGALPVFHKMQRPAENILIVRTGQGLRAVCLAQKEAKQFKEFMHSHYTKYSFLKDVWLVQSDGHAVEDNPYGPLLDNPEIKQILIQCNAFNGRIDYLCRYPEAASHWLYSEDSERKLGFLKLKTARDVKQQKFFYEDGLFGNKATKAPGTTHTRRASEQVAKLGKKEIQALTEKDKGILALLSAQQVNFVLPEQVQFLARYQIGYLREQGLIQAIPEHYASCMQPVQMPHIAPRQVKWFEKSVTKTQAMPKELFEHMSDSQLRHLNPLQIGQIDNRELIGKLRNDQLAYITAEQVKKGLVSDSQIPFINKAFQAALAPQAPADSEKPLKKELPVEQTPPLPQQVPPVNVPLPVPQKPDLIKPLEAKQEIPQASSGKKELPKVSGSGKEEDFSQQPVKTVQANPEKSSIKQPDAKSPISIGPVPPVNVSLPTVQKADSTKGPIDLDLARQEYVRRYLEISRNTSEIVVPSKDTPHKSEKSNITSQAVVSAPSAGAEKSLKKEPQVEQQPSLPQQIPPVNVPLPSPHKLDLRKPTQDLKVANQEIPPAFSVKEPPKVSESGKAEVTLEPNSIVSPQPVVNTAKASPEEHLIKQPANTKMFSSVPQKSVADTKEEEKKALILRHLKNWKDGNVVNEPPSVPPIPKEIQSEPLQTPLANIPGASDPKLDDKKLSQPLKASTQQSLTAPLRNVSVPSASKNNSEPSQASLANAPAPKKPELLDVEAKKRMMIYEHIKDFQKNNPTDPKTPSIKGTCGPSQMPFLNGPELVSPQKFEVEGKEEHIAGPVIPQKSSVNVATVPPSVLSQEIPLQPPAHIPEEPVYQEQIADEMEWSERALDDLAPKEPAINGSIQKEEQLAPLPSPAHIPEEPAYREPVADDMEWIERALDDLAPEEPAINGSMQNEEQLAPLQPPANNIPEAPAPQQPVVNAVAVPAPIQIEPQATIQLPKLRPAPPGNIQNKSVTSLVLSLLVGLIAAGCLVVGAFALIGGYTSFAPQFMVTLYQGFPSPIIIYALTGAGGVFLVGLCSYAIHVSCKRKKSALNHKIAR